MGEPVNGECISGAHGGRQEAVVATVVVHGWTDVPPVNTVGCEGAALMGGFVDKDSGARRS